MIIGLTGGIATGKSLVSKTLRELGIKVIDADQIAHRVLNRTEVIDKIKEEFGREIINNKGEIDRKKLGEIVFSEHVKLKKLEEITHPTILDVIDQKLKEYKKQDLIVLDAPLLFETYLDQKVDETWVVYAEEPTQIERLQKRDGLDYFEAKCRIDVQMPLKEKVQRADQVINNEGTKQELRRKVVKLVEKRI
ncbi:MAG: dephospho-CoA kinase [Halanaerobiales bacterium]|nr:dephospho-CoA kinase [Halanaerobiales bacterium]